MVPSPYASAQNDDQNAMTSGADVVINTNEVTTTYNNEYGDSQNNFELQRSLKILPGSDQYDPKSFQSSNDSKTA